MKTTKKRLVAELGREFGRFAGNALVASYMLKHKIDDFDSLSESRQVAFLNLILDRSISKFVLRARLEEIRKGLLLKLFPKAVDGSDGYPILPEYELYSTDIVRDPEDFIIDLFGRYIGEIILSIYSKQVDIADMRARILSLMGFVDSLLEEFYTGKELLKVHERFVEFMKGKYKAPKIEEIKVQVESVEQAAEIAVDHMTHIIRISKERYRRQELKNKLKRVIEYYDPGSFKVKNIDEALYRFFRMENEQDRSKAIMDGLKQEFGVSEFENASEDTRQRLFEKILKEHLNDESSVGKFIIKRSKLMHALRLKENLMNF